MIHEEIENCMHDFAADETRCEARFRFPASFTGFRGHFADRPTLPGLCIVQAAMIMGGRLHGARPRLVEIVSAKFFSVIGPDADISASGEEQAAPEGLTLLKARFSEEGGRKARIAILLRYPEIR